MKSGYSVRGIVASGLFAAMIFVATFLLHIPTVHGGYVHVGDAFVYLAASLMPLPYAIPAASIGEALSDALSPGSILWALPTLVIKALLTLYFTSKGPKIICRRNIAAVFFAGVTGLAGYYAASIFIYGSFYAPLLEIPMNALQPVASGIVFVMLGAALDSMNIKKRFDFSFKK